MTQSKSSTTQLNAALKLAILRHGTQRKVSFATEIPEVRLSQIIRGRATASKAERRALAKFLGQPQRQLFPPTELTV